VDDDPSGDSVCGVIGGRQLPAASAAAVQRSRSELWSNGICGFHADEGRPSRVRDDSRTPDIRTGS